MPSELLTARKVSTYAMTSPTEFVAEAFVMLIETGTLPPDVMRLYRRYSGPLPGNATE